MDNSESLSDGVIGVHRHREGGFRSVLTDKQWQGPGWVSGQLENYRKSVVGFLPKKQALSKKPLENPRILDLPLLSTSQEAIISSAE